MNWKPRLTQSQGADLSLDLFDASLAKAEGPPQTYTVAELAAQWHDAMYARGLSPHTIRNYLSDVNQFLKFCSDQNIDPLKLTRMDARLYPAFLMKYDSKATLMRKRDAVKQFYRFLKNEHQVNRNEFEFFERTRVNQDLPKFLSQEEAARLLDTIEPSAALMEFNPRGAGNRPREAKFLAIRDKAMLETIYSCGLRAQETANLNWRDIDFRAGFVRVNNGKGGKDRIVPIGDTALEALWNYGKAYRKQFEMEPAGVNPVFPSRRRERITTRNIQRMVALRLKLAGIDTKMSTHGLRHSFATHCMQNGMKISELAECLGHASLSTTQKYTHITMKEAIDNYDMAHPRA